MLVVVIVLWLLGICVAGVNVAGGVGCYVWIGSDIVSGVI